MKRLIQTFLKSESGAVTVDWVVLTALVVGLAIAAFALCVPLGWAVLPRPLAERGA